jgi:hypothetical protein
VGDLGTKLEDERVNYYKLPKTQKRERQVIAFNDANDELTGTWLFKTIIKKRLAQE